MRIRLILPAVLLLAAAAAFGGDDGAPRPARDLFTAACRETGKELAAGSGLSRSASVLVRFAGDKTEFFRTPLMDALSEACGAVYVSGASADTIVTFGIEDAAIGYGPAFREGWFRERRTERSVRVRLRMEMISSSSGKVLYTRTLDGLERDTIAVDEIQETGASARHIAVGAAPEPSLWERILEPAILTVSSGIAVYLFFTVRS